MDTTFYLFIYKVYKDWLALEMAQYHFIFCDAHSETLSISWYQYPYWIALFKNHEVLKCFFKSET